MTNGKLTNPSVLRSLLAERGIRPSKHLGQNFLVDEAIVQKLVARIEERSPEIILEIGPGLGVFTERLARAARRLVAVELDRRLADGLRERTARFPQVEVRTSDILGVDLTRAFDGRKILVFGSLPYRITSPILRHLIEHRSVIQTACVITQAEVAAKIAASPGKDGSALGLLVRSYAEVSDPLRISARCFWPTPKVDSAYWEMAFRRAPRFDAQESAFFQVVRVLYGNRRKMIRRALQELPAIDDVSAVLDQADVDGTARGEALSFEALDRLAQAIARLSPEMSSRDHSPRGPDAWQDAQDSQGH